MNIKLTLAEAHKNNLGLCIVEGCQKAHGDGIRICYDHKRQRYLNNKSGQNPAQLAYNEYADIQLKHELPVISFDEWDKQHQTGTPA